MLALWLISTWALSSTMQMSPLLAIFRVDEMFWMLVDGTFHLGELWFHQLKNNDCSYSKCESSAEKNEKETGRVKEVLPDALKSSWIEDFFSNKICLLSKHIHFNKKYYHQSRNDFWRERVFSLKMFLGKTQRETNHRVSLCLVTRLWLWDT